MRPSKFSEEEMLQALRQVQDGAPAVAVCRRLGITQTTFYRWRKKLGHVAGSGAREARGMRELRNENHKLKEIVANLMLGKLS